MGAVAKADQLPVHKQAALPSRPGGPCSRCAAHLWRRGAAAARHPVALPRPLPLPPLFAAAAAVAPAAPHQAVALVAGARARAAPPLTIARPAAPPLLAAAVPAAAPLPILLHGQRWHGMAQPSRAGRHTGSDRGLRTQRAAAARWPEEKPCRGPAGAYLATILRRAVLPGQGRRLLRQRRLAAFVLQGGGRGGGAWAGGSGSDAHAAAAARRRGAPAGAPFTSLIALGGR